MPSGELSEDVFADMGLGGEHLDDVGYEDEQDHSDIYEEADESDDEVMPEASGEPDEIDDDSTEVERRLNLAQFYKQLTRGGLFTGNSPEARQVDQEVREFARSRMNALVGIGSRSISKSGEQSFTDEQVEALRQLADRLLEQQGRGATPSIRRIEPPAPARKPAFSPPRSIMAEAKRKPLVVPAPAAKTLVRTPARPTAAKTPQTGKKQRKDDLSKYPLDRPFEENGRTYKVTISPHPGDDGKAKRVKMDVTPQVRPPNAIPTPRREHMNLISAQHAHSVIKSQDSSEMRRAAAIVMSSD